MKKGKGLLIAWCVFGAVVVFFFTGSKVLYDSEDRDESCYHYYFKVDEDVLEAAKDAARQRKSPTKKLDVSKNARGKRGEEKEEGTKKTLESKVDSNESSEEKLLQVPSQISSTDDLSNEIGLYEKLPSGYVPKISPDGLRVCDVYAAKLSENFVASLRKSKDFYEIYLVILLDADTDPNYIANIEHRLEVFGNSKVTFVVPHYSRYLKENVRAIVGAGHEFFLKIPTQTSISVKVQGTVVPFLANMSSVDLAENLHILLASTKYAVGVANTTPTLLTKSEGVMSGIADEIARRGLIFLDLEPSNALMQKVSKTNSDFMYVEVPKKFTKGMDIREIFSGSSSNQNSRSIASDNNRTCVAISINDVSEFVDAILDMTSKQGNECYLLPITLKIKER